MLNKFESRQLAPGLTRLEWLHLWGFDADPFVDIEASQEPNLNQYFVSFPYFYQIQGDPSHFRPAPICVFAEHGMGKTAARKMVERICQPYSLTSQTLAVVHTNFRDLPLTKTDAPALAHWHARHIVGQGALALLDILFRQPEQVAWLLKGDWDRLRFFIGQIYGRQLEAHWLAQRIHQRFPDQNQDEAVHWVERILVGEPPPLKSIPPWLQTAFPALLALNHAQAKAPRDQTVIGLIEALRDLAVMLKLKSLYILVDGLEEFFGQGETEAILEVIKPLMSVLRQIEIDLVAFKFFLPKTLQQPLTAFRSDRIRHIGLEWRESDLAEMLAIRLKHFEKTKYGSLARLCNVALAPWIDKEIVRYAAGSPRNLLQLGSLLLDEHCRLLTESHSLLTHDEWRRALEVFHTAQPPPLSSSVATPAALQTHAVPRLRVDLTLGEVFLDGQRCPPLGPLEIKFLAHLYAKRGQICSPDELEEAVYGDKRRPKTLSDKPLPTTADFGDDSNLANLAFHIRNKLEPHRRSTGESRSQPSSYIKFIRGRGYWLDNSE